MQSPQSSQSPQSPGSPERNCFCGCLASPCHDNKYCSERCAREDAENMLMGKPSHYRELSKAEIQETLGRSNSQCQVEKKVFVKANVACDTERKKPNTFKPLPPLPPLPPPRTLTDVRNTPSFPELEVTLLPYRC